MKRVTFSEYLEKYQCTVFSSSSCPGATTQRYFSLSEEEVHEIATLAYLIGYISAAGNSRPDTIRKARERLFDESWHEREASE